MHQTTHYGTNVGENNVHKRLNCSNRLPTKMQFGIMASAEPIESSDSPCEI